MDRTCLSYMDIPTCAGKGKTCQCLIIVEIIEPEMSLLFADMSDLTPMLVYCLGG